jgi:hypothetical protein
MNMTITTTVADELLVNELLVTSQPIELKLILDDLAEKVRSNARTLSLIDETGCEQVARELLTACLDAERRARLAMQKEPELDLGD